MTKVGLLSSGRRRRIPTRKIIESDLPDPVVCQITPSRRSRPPVMVAMVFRAASRTAKNW
jgi:hypothetical protein